MLTCCDCLQNHVQGKAFEDQVEGLLFPRQDLPSTQLNGHRESKHVFYSILGMPVL